MRTAATLDSRSIPSQARIAGVGGVPARPWLQDLWLWVLLVGPLTAPLFAWSGWPILRPFADGIYLLGTIVCPKLSEHFVLLGYPMSVCASCWAAVFGVWTVRLLYGRAGEGMGIFSRLGLAPWWERWSRATLSSRLAVLAAGFLPWALDVMAWDLGLWSSPRAFMMLVGYAGGLAAGALLLPASSVMRAALAHRRTPRYSI
jgi:Predicted membrane protein (DUF2085)